MQIINSLQNLTDSKHNLFPNSVRVTDTVSLRSQFIDLHSSLLSDMKQLAYVRSLWNKIWLKIKVWKVCSNETLSEKYRFFLAIFRSSKYIHLDNNILFQFPRDRIFASTNLLIFVLFFVFTKWTEYCSWKKDKNSHYHQRVKTLTTTPVQLLFTFSYLFVTLGKQFKAIEEKKNKKNITWDWDFSFYKNNLSIK